MTPTHASAILPTATFSNIQNAMAANGITINDLVIAIIGAAGLPWEQLPIQGLQPYSATPSTVHYTISTNVDCSLVSEFTLTARLPNGFFPVNNSAQVDGRQQRASASAGATDRATSKNNGYQWTVDCPGGDTTIETATLTFDSWVGLTLGTFSTARHRGDRLLVDLHDGRARSPCTRTRRRSDPSTATEIKPDTLVAGTSRSAASRPSTR